MTQSTGNTPSLSDSTASWHEVRRKVRQKPLFEYEPTDDYSTDDFSTIYYWMDGYGSSWHILRFHLLAGLCYCAPSYDQDWGISNLDNDPARCPLLSRPTRYIQGCLPLREDGNPRGKYPRKPLPWKRNKLSDVSGWGDDARVYREYLWKKQKQNVQREDKAGSKSTSRGCGDFVKTSDKKQRINKPHFLEALKAMNRRKGDMRYWTCCSWCMDGPRVGKAKYWRSELPRMCREGREEVDPLQEFTLDHDVEIAWEMENDEMMSGLADVTMEQIVRGREMEELGFRVTYRVGKRGKAKRKAVQAAKSESAQHVGDRASMSVDDLCGDSDWDCLDGSGSDDDGSVWTDVEGSIRGDVQVYDVDDTREMEGWTVVKGFWS